DVTAVERVLAGRRRLRVGRVGHDVDQRIAFRGAGGGVEVEVVAPQHVLVRGVAGAPGREIARIAGLPDGAVAHRVDGDVAPRDVVSQGAAGAEIADEGRGLAGQRQLDVLEDARRQSGRRQHAVAAREVDVLREDTLGADGGGRVLAGGGRRRQVAADQDVAQVDRLHVITGQVDAEADDGNREVRPDRDMGQNGLGRGVVD